MSTPTALGGRGGSVAQPYVNHCWSGMKMVSSQFCHFYFKNWGDGRSLRFFFFLKSLGIDFRFRVKGIKQAAVPTG